VKPILLTGIAALLIFAVPLPAKASLGGDVSSVRTDQVHLQGTLKTTTNGIYTTQEVKTPNGVVVREFVSSAGQVFAVAWQGPTRPDLQQVLGNYFQTFKSAVQATTNKNHRIARNSFAIKQPGLVVEMGGHMRWLVGRAYIPTMVPSEVRLEEIR
jgi:hypothetical protein